MLAKTKWEVNWAAVGAIAAVVAIPCTLFFPEVRRWVGVEPPSSPVTTSTNDPSLTGGALPPVVPKKALNKTDQHAAPTRAAGSQDVAENDAAVTVTSWETTVRSHEHLP